MATQHANQTLLIAFITALKLRVDSVDEMCWFWRRRGRLLVFFRKLLQLQIHEETKKKRKHRTKRSVIVQEMKGGVREGADGVNVLI